ncbi:MAG: hypothetical protein D6719_13770 [Candidatus Dadabacteria bacterium]|nr:MAG: hypothetical protein D6719_13770 [Candidatus Dadabacteria bacterium]
MKRLTFFNIIRLFNLLSIDVALGALAGGVLAVKTTGAIMPFSWYLVLPLATWVIYTIDRLLDVSISGLKIQTMRHMLHSRYIKELGLVVSFMAAISLAVATLYFPLRFIIFGVIMSVFSLIHLAGAWYSTGGRRFYYPKEISTTFIYCAGIWGIPVINTQAPLTCQVYVTVTVFAVLVLVNILLYDFYEDTLDKQSGVLSLTGIFGCQTIKKALYLLLLVALVLTGLIKDGTTALVLLAIAIIHLTVLKLPALREQEYYRILAEGSFMLPLLLLL